MQQIRKLQPLSSQIAAPFVTVEFGGAQFGLQDKFRGSVRDSRYVTQLTASKKASGQVNTYRLMMNYVVEPGADPNYIDYIISNSQDRKILFTYGDASQPEYAYVKEQAIISSIVPNFSFSSNSIAYTINATSSVSLSYSIARTFPAVSDQPSKVLEWLLWTDTDNGLLQLFSGMRDKAKVLAAGWIPRNDAKVYIDEAKDTSPLDYARLLLSKMIAPDGSFYAMIIHDEPSNIDGPYFEIVNSILHQGKANYYSVDIDVGYPSDVPVYSFTPTVNTSLALITPFQESLDANRMININVAGQPEMTSVPSLAIKSGSAKPQLQQWWKTMSSYPITAKLRTRGLIKPSILCDYLRINVLFFGQPHTLGGYYMVTAQEDSISRTGYSTELSLIRVEGLEIDTLSSSGTSPVNPGAASATTM